MRAIFVAAAFALLASAAFAQTLNSSTTAPPAAPPSTGIVGTPPPGGPPEVGGPLLPATDAGWDRVAPDGISTQTVRAAPCSKAARETDGTTTCIGIPGPVKTVRGSDFQDGTTTGTSRP
jgi:hypothetical protein